MTFLKAKYVNTSSWTLLFCCLMCQEAIFSTFRPPVEATTGQLAPPPAPHQAPFARCRCPDAVGPHPLRTRLGRILCRSETETRVVYRQRCTRLLARGCAWVHATRLVWVSPPALPGLPCGARRRAGRRCQLRGGAVVSAAPRALRCARAARVAAVVASSRARTW